PALPGRRPARGRGSAAGADAVSGVQADIRSGRHAAHLRGSTAVAGTGARTAAVRPQGLRRLLPHRLLGAHRRLRSVDDQPRPPQADRAACADPGASTEGDRERFDPVPPVGTAEGGPRRDQRRRSVPRGAIGVLGAGGVTAVVGILPRQQRSSILARSASEATPASLRLVRPSLALRASVFISLARVIDTMTDTTFSTRLSGKALASLVLGLLVFTGLPALFLGVQSLREINRSDGRLRGRKLALAGLLTGI